MLYNKYIFSRGKHLFMNRENEILKIIRANSLISQDEIAEKLQIKRSTVGVHILNLQKTQEDHQQELLPYDSHLLLMGHIHAVDRTSNLQRTYTDKDSFLLSINPVVPMHKSYSILPILIYPGVLQEYRYLQ